MNETLYPINCAHMLSQSDSELVFRTFEGKLCKFKSNIILVLKLIRKSTGAVSADEIAYAVSEETGIPVSIVRDAIDDLVTCGILIDSHEQFSLYHMLTYNPPRYPSVLSFSEVDELTKTRPDYIAKAPIVVYKDTVNLSPPVFDILKKRHSCRDFLEMAVELEKLFAICKASYGYRFGPVASAGGLFPLSVYFINRFASKQLPVGLYQYDPGKEEMLLLNADFSEEMIQYALNDNDCIFGAPCIFFVCGDIGRHMKKYANAGYRYTLLEAGHAVQNMTITVGELGLGAVEYGGFCDEAIKKLFQMPEMVFPLACYAVGYEDIRKRQTQDDLQKDQIKYIVEKIVRSEKFHISPFLVDDEHFNQSNLRVVVSKFEDVRGDTEFGTGFAATYGNAYVKSVMEAYERYILSCRYYEQLECADKLEGMYLNPAEYAPYSGAQIAENNLARFRTNDTVEWVQGYDMNGERVYIPADLCFCVSGAGKTPYHIANTSGCAAHFDIEAAKRAALLELIERDAIVRCWMYQQAPYRLCDEELPDNLRRKLQRYRKEEISVFILSLPCEYAYTVLACSVNESAPPYFVSGAAASFSSVSEAAAKAFDEWEVSYVLGGSGEKADMIAPEDVISPKDHGDLYRYKNYNRKIKYLLRGRELKVEEVCTRQLGNISELYPVFFTYRGQIDNVYVVRAFSKELVPVNFGYSMDFFEHVKVDKEQLKEHDFPHFFA